MERNRKQLITMLALMFSTWAPRATAQATTTHHAELLTIGPDASTFGRFGHAVLCVFAPETPEGRCYNYGAARARDGLARDVLLGEAVFLVKPEAYLFVLDYYRRRSREVRSQTLAISPDEFSRLANILADDAQPARREYRYHPFRDNCSTRIRDVIDEATGGRLRAATAQLPGASTYRRKVRDAMHDKFWVLAALDVFLGDRGDRKLSAWDAMFEPVGLRAAMERTFGASATTIVRGRFSAPRADWLAGRWAFFLAAPCLLVFGAWTGRRGGKIRAIGFGLEGVLLFSLALVQVAFALSSRLPEARHNIALAAVLPTDAFIILAAAFATNARPGLARGLVRYAQLRLALLAVMLVTVAVSLARPTLLPILALAGAAVGGILLGLGRGSWRAGTMPPRLQRRQRSPRKRRSPANR